MKRALTHFSILTVFALGAAFAGCADDGSTPLDASADDISGEQPLSAPDLDEDFGGLEYSDEAAGFDDPALLAMMVEDDLALSEDEEDSLRDEEDELNGPTVRTTLVKILWGQLDGDFDRAEAGSFEAVDWSGSVSVTRGGVALKRTILFEKPGDHRLPRNSRDSLAWVSRTGPHYDGILISLISPVEDGVAQGDLVIDTPNYRTTLNVDTLDGYEEMTVVDAVGNSVAIHGKVYQTLGCAQGFAAGFWKKVADDDATDAIEMGVFRGRFVGQSGLSTGFVKGVYGLNSAGERVMVGKVISRNGAIRGLLAGRWDAGDEDGMGSFQAFWSNRRGLRMGTLRGNYQENDADEIGDGFFEGRYAEICGDDPGNDGPLDESAR